MDEPSTTAATTVTTTATTAESPDASTPPAKTMRKRKKSTPVEKVTMYYNLASHDLKLYEGQLLFMYKIDL